jgi:hypothetical protein
LSKIRLNPRSLACSIGETLVTTRKFLRDLPQFTGFRE